MEKRSTEDEYLLDTPFSTIQQMASAEEEVAYLYNSDRPHYSLNMEVPVTVYQGACLKVDIPKIAIPAEQVFMT